MADGEALGRAMRHFAQQSAGRQDVDVELSAFCDLAADALEASGAGVMLIDANGQLDYVAASNNLVKQVNELQTSRREGPCWTSTQSVEVVSSSDLVGEWRWPQFAEAAVAAGFLSVHCFPLVVDDRPWGSFNVFYDRAVELRDEDLSAGRVLAATLAVFLHNVREHRRLVQLTQQLEEALRSRVVIEQAKGKLSERMGVDPEEAFALLRRTARNRQQSLHELARMVVNDETGIDVPPASR